MARVIGLPRTLWRHARNAAWSTLEYLTNPLLMLIATPFFVAWLGRDGYGHWMTVQAVVGLGGAANLGMAAATIRFVSLRRGAGELSAGALIVRQTWTLASAASGALAAGVALAAPALSSLLAAGGEATSQFTRALQTGALLLVLTQVDFVFSAALKGCERFGLSARIELVSRCATIAASLAVAYVARDPAAVLAAAAAVTAVSVALRSIAASRALGAKVYLPAAPWKMDREILRYGAWSCFHGAAAMAFAHLDRILIAGLLGAQAVTFYAVCTQLAAQVHALPAAALGFLLPLMSRRSARGGAGLERIKRAGVAMGAFTTAALAVLLFAFGDAFMRLWMGETFARELGTLLPWLVAAYVMLGLGVAPHFLLLGQGEARFVSLNNAAGGVAASVGAAVLIPLLGLTGGAIARGLYAPLVLASYLRLMRGGRAA
jgi:O-antigen/teichoic acid export membrane protein